MTSLPPTEWKRSNSYRRGIEEKVRGEEESSQRLDRSVESEGQMRRWL